MRQFCDITLLIDRSGSMSIIRDATIAGINAFIEEQKSVPGDGCWTVALFDDPASAKGAGEQFPHVAVAQKCQDEVPTLTPETFRPRGHTALIDAVCRTIDDTGRRLGATPEHLRPSKVLVVIMTDGQENQSREFTRDQLNERIAHQQSRYGWTFVFLGANQDAIAEGAKYGVSANNSRTYQHNAVGTQAVLQAVSTGTRNWKLDGNDSAKDFFVEPKQDVQVNVSVKT